MTRYLFLALALLFTANLRAQHTQDETGNWIMYFGSNRLNDTWSIHTEVQYRNHEVVPNTVEQLLLRTGVNYHFKPNAFATLGYGHITSHTYLDEIDQASSAEHRVWQQLITTQKLGRVKLEHRYRIEQRWISR